jgi:hypothetical protein
VQVKRKLKGLEKTVTLGSHRFVRREARLEVHAGRAASVTSADNVKVEMLSHRSACTQAPVQLSGTFAGYAAKFGDENAHNEIVKPGAFVRRADRARRCSADSLQPQH